MVGRPFQPGVSGNPAGRPKTKPFRDALERVIAAASADADALDVIAQALYDKAKTGDVPAMKEFADRLDGKPAQALEMSGSLEMTHEERLARLK
ncbi:hypothetical protein UFOVP1349_4 [uncultured Caudovirales phage]|uniref:DUF5681 domain-containing protein n=1 Tax=uncultured Caudovirales phage TaxID=2100421 RepID=A0A6J5PS54_9CAUD|nr:hypothetical protein UFOVP925_39 [uncultured Caudovirales phage]CAB4183909.1 hypothetical protein UFOVP1097_10 [uncultured Caudovirales phage]CAB4199631.1 hypothetical protein UFOVP1349_4 [uncultured Caudovirales phage]CAB4214489.1 hypothetical protein UFOVP1456_41 [uncultured Caudovirales phage]